MKPYNHIILLLLLVTSRIAFAGAVAVDVNLSPAGSFKAETEQVQGFAYKTPTGIAAENVIIDMKSLKTGVSLRDKHTKEHLLVEKFPQAKLLKAIGKDGKGEALVEIMGHKQKVKGTYTIVGNNLKAQFPVHLPDVDIKGVRYMGIGVKDEVMINVTLPIQAARATASVPKK
ncbi:MAG: YceI family protein [Bdellovibrionales bacterium]